MGLARDVHSRDAPQTLSGFLSDTSFQLLQQFAIAYACAADATRRRHLCDSRAPTASAQSSVAECGGFRARSRNRARHGRRARSPHGRVHGVFGNAPGIRSARDASNAVASYRSPAQPTHTRALRNMRIHGAVLAPLRPGCQEFCTVRNTRSGCGIRMVTRPSRLVRPVMPRGEPFGIVRVALGRRGRGCRRSAGDQPAVDAGRRGSASRELGAALAVRDGDRQHASRPCRRRRSTPTAAPRPAPRAPRTARSGCARSAASAPRRGSAPCSFDIIWQPLQTPSVNVSGRSKNAANCSRRGR